jgi:hypothetical protein
MPSGTLAKTTRSTLVAGVTLGSALAACQLVLGIQDQTGAPRPADGGDAGSRPEASSPSFCDNVDASLCWSFDDDASVVAAPGYDKVLNDGEMTYTKVDPKSPPRSLDVSMTNPDGGLVALRHHQTEEVIDVTCDFDVRIDVVGTGDVVIAQLSSPTWTGLGQIIVTPSSVFELARFQEQPQVTQPINTIPPGTWAHVTFEVDALNLKLRGSVNGAPATWSLHGPGSASETFPTVNEFHLGLGAVAGQGLWRASFDNVYCSGF